MFMLLITLILVWLVLAMFGEAVLRTLDRNGWQYLCFFAGFIILQPLLAFILVPLYAIALGVQRRKLPETKPLAKRQPLLGLPPKDELRHSRRSARGYSRRHN